jgi:aspartyl/asparaginyl-tRNA synthetase
VDVSIRELLKEYKDNEVRADANFKGKRIRVTGIVDDVKKNITNDIYITLGTGKQFEIPKVQCYFDDSLANQAAQLSKGARVTVEGRVKGLMMNVQVDDCEFVTATAGDGNP